MMGKFKNVDKYFAALGTKQRAALSKLRRTIRAAAPKAEECLSYGMPAFRQGRVLVAYAGWTNHCALYPMSGKIVASLSKELKGYDTSRGTIRFAFAAPLPARLVKKIVQTRLAENAAKDAAKKSKLAKARGLGRRR